MGRINNISTLVQGLKTAPELARFIAGALDSILTQINGKLTFGDNIQSFGPVSVTFSTTLPTKVVHGLGRTPLGYLVTGLDAAAIIYVPNQTSFPWTGEQIYLQSNTANVVADILVF
jgi:hypothetical protein